MNLPFRRKTAPASAAPQPRPGTTRVNLSDPAIIALLNATAPAPQASGRQHTDA